MNSNASYVIISCLLGSTLAFGQAAPQGGRQGQPPAAEMPATPDISGVVAGGTKIQLIKEGFQGAQGATAAPDGSLLFTERMANRITKIDKEGNISSYLENTSATNSASFDSKGRLIGVQWMPAQLGVLSPAPSALASNFNGQPFGRPNDLVIDKKGGVYFSDDLGIPDKGIKPAVYYVSPTGQTIKIADNISRPNGLQLSPDERTLYVADSNGEYVIAFDIQPDGSARNQRNFGRLEGAKANEAGQLAAGADGVAIDAAGRLYVTTTIGVQVLSPQGQHLGTIRTSRPMQNLAFAGPDKKTLYVMGGNAVYRIDMQAQGYKERAK